MCRRPRPASVCLHEATEVVKVMSEVLTGREPVSRAVRPPLIELAGVEKVYRTGKVEYRALRGVDLTIDDGDMVAIVGPSGSGKSTIMNMITGIDRPTAGTVTVDGRRIDEMSEEELAIWRGRARRRRLPVLPAAADADRARERDAAAGLLAPRAQARARARSRCTTSSWSGSPTRPTTCRPSSRAASSSAWRSRARSPPTRRC